MHDRRFYVGGHGKHVAHDTDAAHDYSPEVENLDDSRSLNAHEMAHQWFGDYVACKDWSHLWLNQGFATYYAHLYDGHKFGRDELLYGLYKDAERIFTEGAKNASTDRRSRL